MLARRREYNFRKAHAEHAQEIVGKMDDPTAPKEGARGKSKF